MAGKEIAPRSTGIAVGAPQNDLGQVMELARVLAVSSLLPDGLKGKPADVLVAILYGQELGLAPMQAIQSVYVVKGRPTLSAQLWVALARRAGHKVKVVDEQANYCVVRVTRGDTGDTEEAKYTLDMAKTAGLMSNANWKNHPHAMLYARAASTACRRACPEIALGFGDESEREPEPTAPSLAQVAAEREDRSEPEPVDADPVEDPAEPTADEVAELARIAAEHTPAAALDADPTLPDDPDLFAEDGSR